MNKMFAIREQLFLYSIPDPGYGRPAFYPYHLSVGESLLAKGSRPPKQH
jgi:hypothetical protein